MSDDALKVISRSGAEDITFEWFRREFKEDHDIRASLKSGHAIITDPKQLDQYLYSYALMVESHWKNIASRLQEIAPPTMIIDYACGQGLGAIMMHELAPHLFGSLKQVMLIEPSGIALERAEALYRKFAPQAQITAICKKFDHLAEADIPASISGSTLHIFSNSLDVSGFDPCKLIAKTLRVGHHVILSLSHDRDFNGGTPQIERVKGATEDGSIARNVTIHKSTLSHFTSTNPKDSKGVFWFCDLEVKDG